MYIVKNDAKLYFNLLYMFLYFSKYAIADPGPHTWVVIYLGVHIITSNPFESLPLLLIKGQLFS